MTKAFHLENLVWPLGSGCLERLGQEDSEVRKSSLIGGQLYTQEDVAPDTCLAISGLESPHNGPQLAKGVSFFKIIFNAHL